ncbi:unnamed protein product [uncultured virus]|nr:unnamed protein product [uncultured virus]
MPNTLIDNITRGLTSDDIIAMIIEGKDAIKKTRAVIETILLL